MYIVVAMKWIWLIGSMEIYAMDFTVDFEGIFFTKNFNDEC